MKWRWTTVTEKRKAIREYRGNWHRKFVIWPRYDHDSQIAYCLCRVWRKAKSFSSNEPSYPGYVAVTQYEYRGGNTAPDVKSCPAGITPTAVGIPQRQGMTPPF